jgi:hypothetical protein
VYITARPDRPDNVPSAILDGSRGKAPPVLVARLSLASLLQLQSGSNNNDSNSNNDSPQSLFPLDFTLTAADVTVEGLQQQIGGPAVNANTNTSEPYWWSRDHLIVSARLDSDGVAATRDPNDLVGRSVYKQKKRSSGSGTDANEEMVTIELQGRGVGGKFVTGKKAAK